jgi:hypothetical protein
MTLGVTLFGLYGIFVADNKNVQELSLGVIALGIGLIGVLKSAIEMSEFHKTKSETTDVPVIEQN